MTTPLTWIGIDAPPARVWDGPADFDRDPEWNPFVVEISGETAAAPGG